MKLCTPPEDAPCVPDVREELKLCLEDMNMAASAFYRAAVRAGNHPFVEFCGLMREYIQLCSVAAAAGVDFRYLSVHSGSHLPFQGHHVKYLLEKLECIYGPGVLRALAVTTLKDDE